MAKKKEETIICEEDLEHFRTKNLYSERLVDLVNLELSTLKAFVGVLHAACESEDGIMNSRQEIAALGVWVQRRVEERLDRIFDFMSDQGVDVMFFKDEGNQKDDLAFESIGTHSPERQ